MKRSVVVLALFLGLAASLLAQVQGGTIGGTVQNEQGAVLPGGDGHTSRLAARRVQFGPEYFMGAAD